VVSCCRDEISDTLLGIPLGFYHTALSLSSISKGKARHCEDSFT